VKFKLTGVSMTTPGMLRNNQQITFQDGTTGTITSGSFSPILKHAVGMARVPIKAPEHGQVMQRKQSTEIKLSPLPFIKKRKTVAI
jgi:aminomethyltransferase